MKSLEQAITYIGIMSIVLTDEIIQALILFASDMFEVNYNEIKSMIKSKYNTENIDNELVEDFDSSYDWDY